MKSTRAWNPAMTPEAPFVDYGSDKMGSQDCGLVENVLVLLLPNESAGEDD
jgi:hypothetical protein